MDIASSYRSVERQLLIWNNKWSGKRPLYDRNGELLVAEDLSDDDKLKAILIWSALPGASRHHWGTDLDVYDAKAVEATGKPLELIEAEYTHGSPCFALAQWIDKYLESFGFYRPYLTDTGGVAIEPWHISHQGQSKKVESELSITEFETLLQQIDIRGRDTILKHLDWIWHVYVLNKGLYDV
jgi:LAS superfamily LD-carboxypeptidase LdcB